MSFMCTAGEATYTSKSNTTPAQDQAQKQKNLGLDPLLASAPTLSDALLQSAQARQAQQLLDNSRSQAFGNAPAAGASSRISLLG